MERFEQNIKNRITQIEVQPPEFVWGEIESRLDHHPGFTAIWYKLVASIAFLFITLSASVFYFSITNMGPESVTENNIESAQLPQLNEFAYINASSTPREDQIEAGTDGSKSMISAHSILLAAQEEDIRRKASEQQQVIPQEQNNDNSFLASLETADIELMVSEIIDDILLESEVIKAIEAKLDLAGNTADYQIKARAEHDNTLLYTDTEKLSKNASLSFNANDFTVAAYFSPLQSFRYQSAPGQYSYENVENSMTSYAFGLNTGYKLNNRLEIQTGIGYSRLGQHIDDINAFSHPGNAPVFTEIGQNGKEHPQQLNTSMGSIKFNNENFYFASAHSGRILTQKGAISNNNVNLLTKSGAGLTQQFSYLEIPLMVRYKLFERNLSVGVKAGVSANMLMEGNVYLSDMGKKDLVGQSTDVNRLNFTGTGGVILSYPLNHSIRVNMEPTFNMFMNPIANDPGTSGKTYPYNYSVLMGISYNL